MPVYNGANWLHNAANAVLNQTHKNLELIISDNASTDGTELIGRELAAWDQRVRFIRQEKNYGATANYNTVLMHSRGRYFKWAACSDYCAPTFLERCLDILENDDSVVLAYPRTALFARDIEDAVDFNDNLHLVSSDPYRRFVEFMNNVSLNNVMNGVIRKEALLRTALMRSYFASDTYLMAELALYGKFFEIPETLFFRRMDPQSATKLKSEDEKLRHWNPDLAPIHFSIVRSLFQLFGAIFRAPLHVKSRWKLLSYICRRSVWARSAIWTEVVAWWRHP
jgi:glycosyltransferase involved in cell wall biosynthesis